MSRSLAMTSLALMAVALLAAGSSAAPQSEYVVVRVVFDGADQANFDRWHSNATLDAIATAAGVPSHYVTRIYDGKLPSGETKAAAASYSKSGSGGSSGSSSSGGGGSSSGSSGSSAGSSSGSAGKPSMLLDGSGSGDQQQQQQQQGESSRRRLLGNAVAEFAIRTNASEPWAVRDVVKRKLLASAAGFGMAAGTGIKGFYSLLAANGVTYFPRLYVDDTLILNGVMGNDAPANRFANMSGDHSFAHKLFNPRDLLPTPQRDANASNATAEPSFVMAERSTAAPAAPATAGGGGLEPWQSALVALGVIGGVAAAAAAAIFVGKRVRAARMKHSDSADQFMHGQEEATSEEP